MSFKPVTSADFPLLFEWFKQPYISQLWKEPQEWNIFQEKYAKNLSQLDRFSFLASLEQKPMGYIIYHHINDDDRALFPGIEIPHGSVGLDLFIGDPTYLNKGYGTQLLLQFIEHLKIIEPTCTMLTIDPATDNYRAIACYKKVGFVERGAYTVPYGPMGDGPGPILLMTLLLKNKS